MRAQFAPQLVSATTDEAWYRIDLDASQPFLDDHRPGGAPLFGTVMGVEAVACAATLLASGGLVANISAIRVGEPCVLHEESIPHAVSVRIRSRPHEGYRCTLLTRVPGAADIMHLEATVALSPALPHRSLPVAAPAMEPRRAEVVGEVIYRHFFHGPSFRVVHSAQFQHGSMLCRLSPGLPMSHTTFAGSCSSPRILELGLQTAGLLELASSGNMMIPHTLDSVERISDLDVDANLPLFARACFGQDTGSIDIDILDVHGNAVQRIHGYRTVPLPFAAEPSGLAALAAALQSTAG